MPAPAGLAAGPAPVVDVVVGKTRRIAASALMAVASRTACRETGNQVHCGAPESFVVMVELCKNPVDSGDCGSNRVSQRRISRGSRDVPGRKRHRTSRDATEFVNRCPPVRWNALDGPPPPDSHPNSNASLARIGPEQGAERFDDRSCKEDAQPRPSQVRPAAAS
jgi:hypothetical protein